MYPKIAELGEGLASTEVGLKAAVEAAFETWDTICGVAVALKVAALAEALVAAGHFINKGFLTAVAPLVGPEVARLAKSLVIETA
jgi:hypothetical protein